MTATIALRLEGVSKSFGAVQALTGVSFHVAAGEIHALVGENGAGKSTLMGVAAGTVTPDAGTVEIAGTRLQSSSAVEAEELGLAVVYQDPALVADLTVEENLWLAVPPGRRSSFRERRAWAHRQLERVGLVVELGARVNELVPGQRQLLEIAKALALEPRVLILDEPTESLGAEEVERLFGLVRDLAADGTAVVYISHRIAEVRRIAHRITAVRDGRITGSASAAGVDDDAIVEMIVGRSLSALFPPKPELPGLDALSLVVEELSGPGFSEVSLSVRRGEILGLAGVEGNGQRSVIRALAGLCPITGGRVELGGRQVELGSSVRAAAAGIAFAPADRLAEGLFRPLSVRENVAAASLEKVATAGFVRGGSERERVRAQLRATSVKTESPDSGVLTLSGGNQQKVMFARLMAAEPEVILCDEPTRGVDVGARSEIYGMLRQAAADGHPVIVLSADAAELAGLCDTVAVFSRGRVAGVLTGLRLNEDAIVGAALRATTNTAAAPGEMLTRPARRAGRVGSSRSLRSKIPWRSDSLPAGVLLLTALILALITAGHQGSFLGELNVSLLLYGIATLALITIGQQIVLLTGGIDLSVGPVAGLLVVVMSFVLAQGRTPSALVLGLGLSLAIAVAAGLLNGTLIAFGRLPALIVTLGTYVAFQGVSLLLRPQVGGSIDGGLVSAVQKNLGPIPVAFIIAAALAVLGELALRRTRFGVALRTVGPGRQAAERMGIRIRLVTLAAYVLCAVFTFLGALLLAAQIGTGDPTQGVNYTLSSISAVVLGGASIYGARGSFISAFAGAILLGLIADATTFLGLSPAWQSWLPGGILLIATAISARIRLGGVAPAGA
jgi:ribose transport system ATP-binding protein